MELIDQNLLTNFRLWLNANGGEYAGNDALLRNKEQALNIFQAWILANGNALPPFITPIERHPYLEANPVNYDFRKLVIGTMPPISYMADQLGIDELINPAGNGISPPTLPFFHGNRLSLWKFSADQELNAAVALFGANHNRIALLEQTQMFLQRNEISITDIIVSCQRNEINANDEGLRNIDLNLELIQSLCSRNHQIEILIFSNSCTSGAGGIKIYGNGQINIRKIDAFSLFLRTCQLANITVEMRLNDNGAWSLITLENLHWLAGNTTNKTIFYLRLTDGLNDPIEFIVITPPSPSGQAALGLLHNNNWLIYLGLNPGATMDDYRRNVWLNAMVNDDHALISTWQ